MEFEIYNILSTGTAVILNNKDGNYYVREKVNNDFIYRKLKKEDEKSIKEEYFNPLLSSVFYNYNERESYEKGFEKEEDLMNYLGGVYCLDSIIQSALGYHTSLNSNFNFEMLKEIGLKTSLEQVKKVDNEHRENYISNIEVFQKKFKNKYVSFFEKELDFVHIKDIINLEPEKIYNYLVSKAVIVD